MPCKSCKRDVKVIARGYCAACYSRWRKTGTTEYQRWGKRTPCHIKDCGKPVVSHGLCNKHHMRLLRHGHTEQTRAESWGAIETHPLRNAWRHMRRHRGKHEICPEWQDDFLQFSLDVGEKPSSKHKFFRADESKPFGPGNFVWKRSITERVEGEDEQTFRARRNRVDRGLRKEAHTGYDLKKLYGLSLADYDALHLKQGGCCAICGKKETAILRGKKISLAVDHCHENGHTRGLLCAQCNLGLGCFHDETKTMKRAIEYLERTKP